MAGVIEELLGCCCCSCCCNPKWEGRARDWITGLFKEVVVGPGHTTRITYHLYNEVSLPDQQREIKIAPLQFPSIWILINFPRFLSFPPSPGAHPRGAGQMDTDRWRDLGKGDRVWAQSARCQSVCPCSCSNGQRLRWRIWRNEVSLLYKWLTAGQSSTWGATSVLLRPRNQCQLSLKILATFLIAASFYKKNNNTNGRSGAFPFPFEMHKNCPTDCDWLACSATENRRERNSYNLWHVVHVQPEICSTLLAYNMR